MTELIGLCDRVVVINEGEKMGELIGNQISQENIISTISKSKIC